MYDLPLRALLVSVFLLFFFFQAEDGIRYLVRSRGLGDVYKRQVFTAFAALCDPGDEVICPAPYWTTYPEAITLAGGVPVVVQTDESTGFKVTVEQLDAALTPVSYTHLTLPTSDLV